MVAWRTVGEGVWRTRLPQYYCRAVGSAVLESVRIRRWSGWWWLGRVDVGVFWRERERLLE